MLGKDASDLQTGVKIINGNSVVGELKYISDYSSAGYTGDEKDGHFLALKCTAESGATITCQVIGGRHGASTLDADGLVICRIANNTQTIKITATKSGQSETRVLSLTGLVLL